MSATRERTDTSKGPRAWQQETMRKTERHQQYSVQTKKWLVETQIETAPTFQSTIDFTGRVPTYELANTSTTHNNAD